MSVLITGITGFVGQNLKEFLILNHDDEIQSLDLRRISDPVLSPEVSTVIHLAGKAHDLKKTAVEDEYFDVNYGLTKKLFEAFLLSNATQFIFMSSVKAAADQLDEDLTELYTPDPLTAYGKSKLKAELFIMDQHLPPGKFAYILRPCMIHGPGNKGNLNLLYKIVKKGLPYPLAAFKNRRSFLSVKNLCFILNEIIKRKDLPSGIYNISDDEPLATTEVVRLLARATNTKKVRLWKIPAQWVRNLAKAGDRFHFPLNTERLTKLTESYVVSNAKIKSWLNKELPLNSSEGIRETADSFNKL